MGKKLLFFLLVFFMNIWSVSAQNQAVSGVVSDESGEPLIGVSVIIKGTTNGASTNVDGEYTIPSVPTGAILTFSYVGYITQEVKVTGARHNIVLQADDKMLDEIIVVAYGTASKAGYTGSASSIDKKKIAQSQVSNVSRLLEGAAAGVQSIASSGQPGSEAEIFIRGIGSINASSRPLYIVDGAPYDGDLSSINPADIESLNVMKDAASTALYGSRAGNGLVIITTKQGQKNDKVKVDASFKYGFSSRAVKDYETVGTNDYFELYWSAVRNQEYSGLLSTMSPEAAALEAAKRASSNVVGNLGINPYGSKYPEPVGLDGKLVAGATPLWNDDWVKEYDQNAKRKEVQLGISGGGKKMGYYVSLGYLDEQGIALASDFKRYSGRVNLNAELASWVRINTGISLNHTASKSPAGEDSSLANTTSFARNMPSFYPIWVRNPETGAFVLDANGKKQYDYGYGNGSTGDYYRPSTANPKYNHLGSSAYDYNKYLRDMASIRGSVEIDIIKGLMYKGSANLDYTNRITHNYANPEIGPQEYNEVRGSVSKYNYRDTRFTGNNLLTYTRSFADIHNMKIMVGQEYFEYNTSNFYGSRSGLPVLGLEDPGAASQLNSFSGSSDGYKLMSYFGNAEYNYDHKYYASASIRRDGSSKFHKDSRWGTFWALGASWRLKQEKLLKDISAISLLTLRASYGGQGNDSIGNYAYMSLWTIKNNLGSTGYGSVDLDNPDLKWETNLNLNIAVDFGFFDKRLSGAVEFFQRRSKDLLFSVPKPSSSGYSSYLANIGALKNTGIEFQLNGIPIETKDFKLNLTFNATHYKNEITKLPQEEGIISGTKFLRVGGTVYDYFLVEWAGIDPEDGLPQWYKATASGERVKTKVYNDANTTESKIIAGSSLPKVSGGFGFNLKYKDFDFATLFSYSLGGKLYNTDKSGLLHNGTSPGRAFSVDMLDAWSPENPYTNIPRMQTTNASSWQSSSTNLLVDGDYMRMKNITLGYTVPKSIIKKWSMQTVRVYAQAENFLTLFGTKGLDPEQNINGNTYYRYPAMKTISFGINVGF